MGFLAWIILGGLAGWIASMFMGTDGSQGLLLNIVIGIVGAMLGVLFSTFLVKLVSLGSTSTAFLWQ